jgi:hypothetical protein
MANIPIDLQPFVPPGFQIQHIEGQTAVHRVVLPRRPRRHEEFAIATILPMSEGQVHFANVCEVLEDFLANVARVGVRDVQKCPFVRHMCDLHITEIGTGWLFRVRISSRTYKFPLSSTMRVPTGGGPT